VFSLVRVIERETVLSLVRAHPGLTLALEEKQNKTRISEGVRVRNRKREGI